MPGYIEQRLKIRHLRVIDAVGRHSSLLRASHTIGISQSALTRTLQEVEEIIGAEAFERHARGMRPNAIGAMLVERSRFLLATLSSIEVDLALLIGRRSRHLRVGALPVAAHGLLPALLRRLGAEPAAIDITLREGRSNDLLPALRAGELDLVIGRLYDQSDYEGLLRLTLYNEPISFVARTDHPVFATGWPDMSDVTAYKLVVPAVTSLLEGDVRLALDALGLAPGRLVQSSSVGLTRELLLETDYIAAMPRILAAGDLRRGTLRLLPLGTPMSARPAGIIYRSKLDIAGQALLSELRQTVAELAIEGIVEPQEERHEVLQPA